MKKLIFAFAALATTLVLTPVAKADLFDFTYTASDGVTGSGTLVGTDLGSGEWLVVSASGVFNDGANSGSISLIQNPNAPGSSLSPSGLFAYDDLLFPYASVGQVLDPDGLLFSFSAQELNLWQTGGGPGSDGWAESSGDSGTGTFSFVPETEPSVPEPGYLPLLGIRLLVLALLLPQRAKASGRPSNA